MRDSPIERVVDKLELALPDRKRTLIAKSAISQARQRLGHDPLAYLFTVSAAEWSGRSADSHRWRGLALYGLDGTTMRVADSPENRATFGGHRNGAGRGESGYPLVRVVAMLALRSHVLSAFRFADFATGETTLARGIWNEVPEDSLVIVDRNFLVKKDLIHLETSGNRHWLSRTKVNTKWAIREKLGKDDYLVEWGCARDRLTVDVDPARDSLQKEGLPAIDDTHIAARSREIPPAKELVELYHERWETEVAYDEVKTHLLDRQESIRSKTPEGVRQELWGIALAYNLVRVEMERAAPPKQASLQRGSASSLLSP